MSQPWERRAHESAKSFRYFCVYRDMGPERSIVKTVTGESTAKLRWLEHLSSKWQWVARAAAYDDEVDRQKREASEAERRSMAERHARLAMLMQSAAIDQTRKWLEEVQASEKPVWTPDQLNRIMATSVQIERVARGEPSEIIRKEGEAGAMTDTSKWTVEDFRTRMVELFRVTGKTEAEARTLAAQLLGLEEPAAARLQ
jgi:hypothetical protein